MLWGDNWLYPAWADKNGDGKVDFWEQTESDYEYDVVMGTNISGAFPEHDKNSLCSDEEDAELAEEYSVRLDFQEITSADFDGYFTSDGCFYDWEIDDMFDYSDNDGFWDKCGNYHMFAEYDDEDYDADSEDDYDTEYFDDIDYSKIIKATGRWIDGTCFIYGRKNHDNYMGAYCDGVFYSYSVRGDWREPDPPGLTDDLSVEELHKKVSNLIESKFAHKMEMHLNGTPAYEGNVGFWYNDVLYFADFDNKYIGTITKDGFIPIEEYHKKASALISDSAVGSKTPGSDKNNFSEHTDPSFSESSETAEPEITFSNTATGRIFASAYENFKEIKNFVSPEEFENDYHSFAKIYSKDRVLGAECWSWIIENYCSKLLDDPKYEILRCNLFMYIPSDMFIRDDEDRNKFLQHYIAERPELMDVLFSKFIYIDINDALFQFLGWSIVRNDFPSFEKAYNMILKNRNYMSSPAKKEYVLEQSIIWRNKFARSPSSEKFYVFFREEIKTIEHAGKRQHLNDILRHRLSYGFPFAKPSTEQQYSRILQDIPSIKDNVPAENISQKPAQCKKAASSTEMVSKEKAPEEKAAAAVIERNADINTELHVLYERKRTLEEMIAEIDIKIEKLESCSATEDEFFTNAEVVGMKYYDCSDGELVIGTKLTLVRDLENEYDSNAVAVYDDKNRKVGFITKRTNSPLAKGLDNGRKLYAKVSSTPIPDHYPNMKIEVFEEK